MNEYFVINLGRELGSGGHEIAVRLSKRLGIKFYDKSLIHLAAQSSGLSDQFFERADESAKRGVLSTLVSYFKAPFSGSEISGLNPISNDALFQIQSDVIRDLASKESAIFVGRCADYILRDNPRCVNIFVSADIADRVGRVKDLYDINEDEAIRKIEIVDAQREEYYNYYSTKRWGVASTYHLCVNSSLLGIDETVEYIAGFVKRLHGGSEV